MFIINGLPPICVVGLSFLYEYLDQLERIAGAKLIAFYNDNHISIDGNTYIAFTED
ncbi:hypothetical protein ACJX0J_008063, partial [Zea mays]